MGIPHLKTSVEIKTHETDSFKKGTPLDRTVFLEAMFIISLTVLSPSQKEMAIL